MKDFDSDSSPESDWDERGELAWNEFDWENYLREQDDVVRRYLAHYEGLKHNPERIDEIAHLMGWDQETWNTDENDVIQESADAAPADLGEFDLEPYTLYKNPVFIATKAIYLSLTLAWQRMASDPAKVAQPLALAFQIPLHRGEQQAGLAIQALDLGDYAMAISLFKRALRELNTTLSLLDDRAAAHHRAMAAFREDALPRLFDLREIWLRVMSECRSELERPVEEDDEG
ncbi:MAG TPA: hypothetical protein VK785_06850 [Opitutaceae bacterium]|jgi:hypothetical protein|nr:hypothetical protein [Opitutaceae bacterium]